MIHKWNFETKVILFGGRFTKKSTMQVIILENRFFPEIMYNLIVTIIFSNYFSESLRGLRTTKLDNFEKKCCS